MSAREETVSSSPVESLEPTNVAAAATPSVSRRQFLAGATAILGGMGLLPWLEGCATAPPVPAAQLPWEELRRKLSGPLLRPGDRGYLAKALPWNRRYAATRPAGIASCRNSADVQQALLWARDHRVPLIVRSGGHSYAGYSTTEGLMIDVSGLNSFAYDQATGRAVLGGGARNASVYEALRPLNRAVVHGRCLGVGVAGLTLGGGIGFNMRRFGVTCDLLESTEVVTSDGEILTCDRDRNPELYWACRGGGGGNFGVNTSFTFQTFPVSEITVFSIQWTAGLEEVFAALVALLPATPDRLGGKVSVRVSPDGSLAVALLGQLVGSPQELRGLLEPAYAKAKPGAERVEVRSYWDGQTFLSEEGCPEYSHESSRYVYKDIPAAGVATIFDYLRRWPGTSLGADWKAFLVGGAIDRVGRRDTAYVHRGASQLSSIEVEWNAEDPKSLVLENLAWQMEFHQAMAPFTSSESFQNFIDASQENYLRAYYAENLERLVAAKKRYDPSNTFKFPQSLPLSL